MAVFFGDSSEGFMQQRRRRSWQEQRAVANYIAAMSGYGDDASASTDPVMSSVIGAEVAAEDSNAGDASMRAIAIGVTTGVLTFLLNRWLGKVLG